MDASTIIQWRIKLAAPLEVVYRFLSTDRGREAFWAESSTEKDGTIMIARTWRGAVPAEQADAYYDYLLETGVPDYRKTPDNRGVYVFRRMEGDTAHFLLLTLWESLDAIETFAGPDVERARYRDRLGWIMDPEGNKIELWEPPEDDEKGFAG